MRSQHSDYEDIDDLDDFDILDFEGRAPIRRLRKEKHRRQIRRHLGPGSKEHWDDEDYDNFADDSGYIDSDWSDFSH
jgi:hypothetical protein